MSWRKGLVQHSKFRNVYGEPYRKDKCYENVKFSKNAWDGTYCSVNPKFLAVVLDTSGAGGAFVVIPLENVGFNKHTLHLNSDRRHEKLMPHIVSKNFLDIAEIFKTYSLYVQIFKSIVSLHC